MKLKTILLSSVLTFCIISSFAQDAPLFKWAAGVKVEGGNTDSYGYGVTSDAAGNVYTTGSFNGANTDFDPGPGTVLRSSASYYEQDIFITKLDADGNFSWVVTYGTGTDDFGYGIAADAAGNVYVTGLMHGGQDYDPGPGSVILPFTAGGNNFFILKLDTDGNFVWVRGVGPTGGQAYGLGVTIDDAGNILVNGSFSGTMDFDSGPGVTNLNASIGSGFVEKLDKDGNFIWARNVGGSILNASSDASNNVLLTGAFLATGDFDPGAGTFNMTPVGSTDTYVCKLDASGNFVWAKSMGGTGSEFGKSLASDNSGNIFVTGNFTGTSDFDPGAGTFNMTGVNQDSFIMKLDASGNFSWAMSIQGSSNESDQGKGIAIDDLGNVLATGYFNGTADFDPGPGTYNLTSVSSTAFGRDIYLLKLTNSGTFIWAVRTGTGTQPDEGNAVAINSLGEILVTGYFSTQVDFDFGPCTYNVSGAFNTDINSFTEKIVLGPTYIPTLTSIAPTSGPVGTVVTITGTGFNPSIPDNVVRFGTNVASVSAVSSTTITATVPSIGNGSYNTQLISGCTSIFNGPVFTVTSAGALTITTQPSASTVCDGSNATFTTAASGASGITYQWQFSTTSAGVYTNISNGGGYSNVSTASLTVNTTGNFGAGFYRCKVDATASATKYTNPAQLTISSTPNPPTATSGSRCGAGVVALTAAGASAGQYRWYNVSTGGTAIAGATSATYSPSVSATTIYYVSIRIGTCESSRISVTATVNNSPTKPTISSSITPVAGNVSFCSSNSLTLTAPSGFSGYLWSSGATTRQIVITTSGNYTVSVTGTGGCVSPASDALTVTVLPAPCSNSAPVISEASASTEIEGSVSITLMSLISDSDNNIDIQSLKVITQPESGAAASISNGVLTVDYEGVSFSGSDKLTIEACDLLGSCSQREVSILVIGELVIYNGISPNSDDQNDFWFIQYIDAIEDTKNNKVSIYNRWGDEVFKISNYDNDKNIFHGIGTGGNELPSGTYYYKIEFMSSRPSKMGYLVLKR